MGATPAISFSAFSAAQKSPGIMTFIDSTSSVIWSAVLAPQMTAAATSGMAANCKAAVLKSTPWALAIAARRFLFAINSAGIW